MADRESRRDGESREILNRKVGDLLTQEILLWRNL